MTLHSLPLFVRLAGRAVILLGDGEPADAKRRLLERAGAVVSGEDAPAALAIVAIEDEADAVSAVTRLKARGILVNAVDRPALCDFTLPAIVDRAPVLIAIGTGGVSAGLAAALRQRLETILPAGLGRLADALFAARGDMRVRFPDGGERRRAIASALAPGGALDPLSPQLPFVLRAVEAQSGTMPFDFAQDDRRGDVAYITLGSPDPDDLTLRQALLLANADHVVVHGAVPSAILDRARADAARSTAMPDETPALTVVVAMA